AFSVEDMMNSTEDQIAAHSETVRARLAEIHETLRIDFPVYVLFTKADLIAGFREYFSSFNVNRRKAVWGVTFQTRDRKAQTFDQVAPEFDRLVSRLSDEVMDRLTEEPDGISRIAIFGLPGQMALLRDNVTDFLRRVFEPTRYKTNAILRGFYFTSGTQEGTPIDQVLGEMSRNNPAMPAGFSPSFMSGQGRSFFLHDLLRRVIFVERDWVSHDIRAVRRSAILRGMALTIIALATVGLMAGFGFSFWQNRELVMAATSESARYAREAQDEIARTEIDDPSLDTVLPYLERLRMMPTGYGADVAAGIVPWSGFGLNQSATIQAAARQAYGDALEQMLRPRLILDVESRLQRIRNEGDPAEIYRALKVYMLLGGREGRTDDAAIQTYFEEIWRDIHTGIDGLDRREQLSRHLAAMLELDGDRDVAIPLDGQLIANARQSIVLMSVADQAYALLLDRARAANLPDFNLAEQVGNGATTVFTTTDGSDLSALHVPGFYTYEGFWGFFLGQLAEVRSGLEADKWVLGDQADRVDFDAQLAGLDQALQARYRQDFVAAWNDMLGRIALTNLASDPPSYDILAVASAPFASPILKLVELVSAETTLTAELALYDDISPESLAAAAAGGGLLGDISDSVTSRFQQRSYGVQRILVDALLNSGKAQDRVSGSTNSLLRPIEAIENEFTDWHVLIEGQVGQRPIDVVLLDLAAVRDNLRLGETNPAQSAALLPQLLSNLTRNNSRLPAVVRSFVNKAEGDFRNIASNATLEQMERALSNDITFNCRENIKALFPFSRTDRQVAPSEFGKFFGPGGDMDLYYSNYLAGHVIRTDDGLAIDPNSPLADILSPNALRSFEQAERIRRAFFASGTTVPEVAITVTHVDSHPLVEQAQLEINGTNVITAAGDPPRSLVWPGQGASVSLQLFPGIEGGNNAIQFRGGAWAIVQFMNSAASRQIQGTTMRVTYQIGGRYVTYDLGFNTAAIPFTMRELAEFECPQGLGN
ncbi:MAG: type VI secretion system membrane subunit TssM, partial [Rubellimicrobium sp.]|nr:type VI secretion system membrane subunit TssM [Rubellimicrobium sp.]